MGGTMRLGSYDCHLTPGSKVSDIYQSAIIQERHRHRYEVNMTYKEQLESVGLYIVGVSPDNALPEIIERRDHPWFIAVQFHPELKSKPFAPHPLFVSFIKAAIQQERLV
jgi:CTP synthase